MNQLNLASFSVAGVAHIAARQAKHKAVITLAAKICDWQTLLFAVEDMIADQKDFVGWWDAHVHRKGGERWFDNADRHDQRLSMEEAEELTKIKQWQVSRWRTAHDHEDAYRDKIIEAAQRKAGLRDKDPMAARGQPDRDGPDFWPTPHSLVEAACEHVVPYLPSGMLWECAAGDGRLGQAFHKAGRQAIMTDKYPQDDSDSLDFLTDDPPCDELIAITNCPFNATDAFIKRGLELLDGGAIEALVLLLRHDHFMGGNKVEALNRATREVHCNWRPIWIDDTFGNPRWAFAWVQWDETTRRPPLYLREGIT
jgi:hypothetical protein